MEITTKSEKETKEFGKSFGSSLTGGEILALSGPLGAGKTTFTQGLVLGLASDDRVTSPTFILLREYEGKCKIYHFDLYRLEGEDIWEEVRELGIEDMWGKRDTVVVIEWAEKIIDHLPEDTIWFHFEGMGDERTISFSKLNE